MYPIIRAIKPEEYLLLEDFLYHAIFLPEGAAPVSREIIYEPEIFIYVKDFGGESDYGVVAEIEGIVVGAAWARIISAYGNIDDETPELAISILPSWRDKGIGTKLMVALFGMLKDNGYVQTSLSVQQNNPAVEFYKRLGYVVTAEKQDHAGNEDYIMVKVL